MGWDSSLDLAGMPAHNFHCHFHFHCALHSCGPEKRFQLTYLGESRARTFWWQRSPMRKSCFTQYLSWLLLDFAQLSPSSSIVNQQQTNFIYSFKLTLISYPSNLSLLGSVYLKDFYMAFLDLRTKEHMQVAEKIEMNFLTFWRLEVPDQVVLRPCFLENSLFFLFLGGGISI